ncbi:MAG TPA: hypothetical protein VH914_03550 [Acidimicrobiia bacterium]|jgi:hypothetical protein|nr:hypothetical protein [Acidimicrobiia bacterium]
MAVLVATDDGYRIISSSGDVRRALDGHRVEAFTPGPDGTWIAIVDEREVWQHGADGEWTPLATADAQLACLVTLDDVVYAGAVGPQVYRFVDGALAPVADLDAVAGRDEWHRVGWDLHVRSMTKTVDGALLANVHVGGIIRSTDQGTSWEPTIDVDADVHEVRAHPTRAEIVVAAAAVGFCVSRDGGRTWAVLDDGLHATYARAVAFAGDDVLVSISDGPFATRSAIYRVRDIVDPAGTSHPERVGDGLPEWLDGNVDTRGLAASDTTLALADGSGSVWIRKGGDGWTNAARDLSRVNALAIV